MKSVARLLLMLGFVVLGQFSSCDSRNDASSGGRGNLLVVKVAREDFQYFSNAGSVVKADSPGMDSSSIPDLLYCVRRKIEVDSSQDDEALYKSIQRVFFEQGCTEGIRFVSFKATFPGVVASFVFEEQGMLGSCSLQMKRVAKDKHVLDVEVMCQEQTKENLAKLKYIPVGEVMARIDRD